MYSLILKDFLMLKKMLLIITGLITLWYILQFSSIFIIALAGFLFISNTGSFEDRNNSHIMLNSLPINRKSIISSKYIGALIFGIVTVCLASLFQVVFYFVFDAYTQPFPEAYDLLIGILCIFLFTSIYYPILYKFGEKYTRIIMMFIGFTIIVFGNIMMHLFKDKIETIKLFLSQFTANQLILTGSVITVLLFLLSWLGTIKIYEAKDF